MSWRRSGLLVVVLLANACGGSGDETRTAEAEALGASETSALSASAYCAARGSSTAYEWIGGFTLDGATRTTGNNGGYYDATGLAPITLYHRATATITLRPGYTSTTYPEYWVAWIDYNHDGVLSDTERVLSGSATGEPTRHFTPPVGALVGPTLMRVAMTYGSAASSPCGTYTWGEVEDHVVNLLGTPVVADSVVFGSTDVAIGGSSSYDITLTNRTSSVLTGLYVQGWIDQGRTSRAAGGAMLSGCGGTAYGDMAPGSCTMNWVLVASNSTSGSGTLVPGPAVARIEIRDSTTVYGTWQVPVALSSVSPAALIGLKFTPPALEINGWTQYVATITNTTTSTITGLYLQGYIEQQGVASRAAGGAMLYGCGGSAYGDLAPGTCTMSMSLGASNSSAGAGILFTGPATARIELRNSSTVIATWRVPITL